MGAGTAQGLEFLYLISNMTALVRMKWVGICFHGNPAHTDQRTSAWRRSVECVFTCHYDRSCWMKLLQEGGDD